MQKKQTKTQNEGNVEEIYEMASYIGDTIVDNPVIVNKKTYDAMQILAKILAETSLNNGGEHAIFFVTYLDDNDKNGSSLGFKKYNCMVYFEPVPLTDQEFEERKKIFFQKYRDCKIHVLHKDRKCEIINGKSENVKKSNCRIIYADIKR